MGTARKGEAAGLHRLRFREETYSSNVPLTITSEFRIRKRPLETTSVRFQFSSKAGVRAGAGFNAALILEAKSIRDIRGIKRERE